MSKRNVVAGAILPLRHHGADGLEAEVGDEAARLLGGKGVQVQLHVRLQGLKPSVVVLEQG